MSALHAVQKVLADHPHPRRGAVAAGEYLEIEPDVFSVIISFNPTEAEHLVADLPELGVPSLPIRAKIIAFSDHGSPAASASNATGHKRRGDVYRARACAMRGVATAAPVWSGGARVAAILAMTVAGGAAIAQEGYPTRPVRLIVPSSPGGGTDTSARIVAPRLTELLGQQVVVENRPGASAMLGAELVARAAPDGYTVLIHNSTLSIYPAIHQKIRVDPLRDLAPLSLMLVLPQVLVSHPSLPTKNVQELIAFIKARPGKLDFAGGGVGGNPHMSMELFLSMTGLKATYVPYKSGNAGLVDVLSGQVPLMMGSMLSVLPHVRQGRLRAYGVTGMTRAAGAPDIPTIAESGVPGYESIQWFGMFAPAATPKEIVQRLHTEITRAVQEPDMRKRFVGDGGDPRPSASPEAFAAFIRADLAKWAGVVKAAGIKPVQ